MSEPVTLSYYSHRGTIFYTPAGLYAQKIRPATLPAPPCRPRQRRPHLIHITRLPAGFVPFDLRPVPPSKPPKKPSRLSLELRKLASRENAKRVLGSVFSPFTSNFPTASSSAASSTRSESPGLRVPSPRATPRASLSLSPSDPNTIFARRAAAAGSVPADSPTMPRSSMTDSTSGSSARDSTFGASTPASSMSAGTSPRSSLAPAYKAGNSSEMEKPVCSGNGVACYINLAEPVIFLTGLDHDGTTRDSGSNTTSILRGKLILNVTKNIKLKAVTMKFTGRARTEWPEGIPPEKTITFEEDSLRTQVLPFFNALYQDSDTGYGTLCNYALRGDKSANSSVTNLALDTVETSSGFSLPGLTNRSNRSSAILTAKEQKRLSLQSNQSRSFTKSESPFGPSPQQKGFKTFYPGIYEYNFELPIDNNSPETLKLVLASVKWQLEVVLERAGTFKQNLQGFKEIPVIRSPSEDSLELVEPISISRRWEDQLYYEIMISGKSFPLGSKIPIAFKMMPLAKVQVHKIKVILSENIDYYAKNRKVTRRETARKILLFEKSAGKPLAKEYQSCVMRTNRGGEQAPEERSHNREYEQNRRRLEAQRNQAEPEPLPDAVDNLLGDIDLGLPSLLGATELEVEVQLPTCEMMAKDRSKKLTHDCTWKNVDVHHWIKIVLRISRLDAEDPLGKKRRHFEISIDSPISLLNCRATQANLALPSYSDGHSNLMNQQHVCGCPNSELATASPISGLDIQNGSNSIPGYPGNENALPDLARPPQAHLSTNAASGVQRPIHLMRAPSFNPPPFDAEEAPPPMVTPPPLYDHVVGTPSHDGLADYFDRLSYFENQDSDDEEGLNRVTSRGRVNVPNPRTLGGRIARSMDIDRNFMNAIAARNNGSTTPTQSSGPTLTLPAFQATN
ncbi:hypothetical protein WAI453_008221 [Rhynchosporium graminicola]|uniref:Arrestin C-terminal-like domain-containing protein n=1 Tax=Rhynchosporium graminicola TaxID=2792576 RepID=A0A1E1KMW5_9HELO|nr:uncharacterized protein RCO7_00588 [Rhynchosporium commune]